jgi:predicted Zn-dependent protease with MMP-like domain/Flp pilus assembly protein TadD
MKPSLEDALRRADEALEDEQFEEALAAADAALAVEPRHPDALELRGHALAGLGELEAADEAFARLLEQEPKNAGAWLLAADLKIRQPGDDAARSEEGLALLAKAEGLVKRDPGLRAELEFLKGLALSQLGALAEALAAFDRARGLDPEHTEAQLERSIALFELGRLDEAGREFQALARDFPDDAWAVHYQGLIAERRGRDAEPFFARARRLAPDDFPPPVCLSPEAFDRAVEEALAALPEHAKPHLANVIVTAQPLPSDEDVAEGLSPGILGVFQGTPLDERLDTHAGHHETARIVLFQKNLERFARTRDELLEEIRITVLHEVGHLLGLDEDELAERGLD